MLNFNEFQDYVEDNIKNYMSAEYQDCTISKHKILKNNGVELYAISVSPIDSNVAPNIYLNDYFDKYEKGVDLEEVVESIATIAVAHIDTPEEFKTIGSQYKDFEQIKDKIVMVAINAEKNKELIKEIPHQMREDLALIYKVLVGNSKDGMATITIRNEHVEMWQSSVEEIHEIAMKNTKEILPITIRSMNEVMREMFSSDGMPDEMAETMFAELPKNQQMYVISNEANMNGAASIFYEGALSDLAEEMGTDLYILPSSVHECIAVSTEMGSVESFAEMVKEVNSTQVAYDEQLSDHVYRFDAKEKKLSLADTTLDQIKALSDLEDNNENKSQTEGTRRRHHR